MSGCPLGGVVVHALLQQLECGLDRRAVGQPELAQQERIGADAVRDDGAVRRAVPPQLVLRVEAALLLRHFGAHEHAELVVRLVHVHELPGIRVADQELAVVQSERDQFVNQREQQRTIRAGLDRQPIVGDRRVAGADRIDRDEAPAVALELRDGDLERVRVMVLGGADHHEEPGALEVGAAEFPEGAADRVDHACGHVDRAESAMRGVIGGAELAGEESGQRLHLVAAGEERELLRIGCANLPQALFQQRERLVPRHFDEFPGAALGAGLALERSGQPRRRVLLHDSRRTLGAKDALVQRVVGIAVDVPDLAVAQMHPDAATASAHVARRHAGLAGRVTRRRRQWVV